MDIEELLALERAGWDSLCEGTGDRFYGDVMTGDARMVLANGQVMTRDEVVGALGQAPPWASYEIADPQLVTLGDDEAAIVYVGTGHRGDDEPSFTGTMSSVYVRDGDRWRLALYQQTPIP